VIDVFTKAIGGTMIGGVHYYWLTRTVAIRIENKMYNQDISMKKLWEKCGLPLHTMHKAFNRAHEDGKTKVSETVFFGMQKEFPKLRLKRLKAGEYGKKRRAGGIWS
jgi:hypothetical protein